MGTHRSSMVLALILAASPVYAQGFGSAASDPNAEVLAFARSQLGNKVGNGQCTSLVIAALESAGARGLLPRGFDADYEWGEYVENPEDVRPGDLLQFRDAVFRSKKRVRSGRGTVVRTETHLFPHHSAVVEEVRDGGRIIVILHQNAGPESMPEAERMTVQRGTLDMDDLQEGGWIKAYHPVAP